MSIFHYLKNTIRKTSRFPVVVTVRLTSGIIGVLSISIILSFVINEITIDRFHKYPENIYAFIKKNGPLANWQGAELPIQRIDFKEKIPALKQIVNVKEYSGENVRIKYNTNAFISNGFVVDSTFFDVFSFETEHGNPKEIIRDPQSIIISHSLARKIFGDADPLGKTISVKLEATIDYTVKGILKEIPSNSTMQFNFLVPMHSYDGYFGSIGVAFVRAESFPDEEIISSINEEIKKIYVNSEGLQSGFIPLTKIYNNDQNIQFYRVISKHGNIRNIYILSIIALILAIVTVLNCSGLKLSEVFDERKSLALNKLCGATFRHRFIQIIIDYSSEVILTTIASICLYILLEPWLHKTLGFSLTQNSIVITMIFGITAIILFTAHITAFLLSARFNSYHNLSEKIKNNSAMFNRKWITSAQFAFTIFLIISAIVVNKQYQAMINKDMGFETKNIIKTSFFSRQELFEDREKAIGEQNKRNNNFQMLISELDQNPHIISFTFGSLLSPYPMEFKRLNSDSDFESENILIVTPGYGKTLGLTLKEGRFFDWELDDSRGDGIVINEAAMKKYDIHDISTERLINKNWSNYNGNKILGIVEDFNYEHVATKVRPLVMYYFNDMEMDFLIKVKSGHESEAIEFLRKLNGRINPGLNFSYSFLSDEIKQLYDKEKRLSQIYLLFTLVVIFISSIGLFAFAYSTLQHRIKEIGIRKVNGAKIFEILAMLNRDFIKWVLIAFVVASPLAWYAMNKWLENFAYKTELSWWIFVLAGLMALGIALLTVSWQSWRAATRNPVEALRYE